MLLCAVRKAHGSIPRVLSAAAAAAVRIALPVHSRSPIAFLILPQSGMMLLRDGLFFDNAFLIVQHPIGFRAIGIEFYQAL